MTKPLVRRLLFVTPQYPSDFATATYGGFQRMRVWLEALAGIAEETHILFFGREEDLRLTPAEVGMRVAEHWGITASVALCAFQKAAARGYWAMYGAPAFSWLAHPEFSVASGRRQIEALRESLARRPDVAFFHRLLSISPVLRAKIPLPTSLLDLDDVEHLTFLRSIRQPPSWASKPLLHLQVPALALGERRAVGMVDKAFVCSEKDRAYLARWCDPSRLEVVPNSAEMPSVLYPAGAEPTLLFLGSYTYQPNIESAEYLVTKVWPRVHEAVSGARLIIAGNKPERIPSFSRRPPGVTFAGFVSDLVSLYREVRVVCVPILWGGGTRIKIIEAASYAKAVVSTRIGVEGLELRDGTEILIRDDPISFAHACVELLTKPERGEALGRAARAAVVERYDRSIVIQRVRGIVADLVATREGSTRGSGAS